VQYAQQHVGEGAELQPGLVGHGPLGGGAGAVGEHVPLLLLDEVFHVTASAMVTLVKVFCIDVIRLQAGDHEARIGAFEQVLGLAYDPSRAAPTGAGPVGKLI